MAKTSMTVDFPDGTKSVMRFFKCERCTKNGKPFIWSPNSRTKDNEIPIVCPNCNSPYWNKDRKTNVKIKKKK